jgi:hypothetical protein
MSSFMLEARQDVKWDSETSTLRFDKRENAEEWRRRVITQYGISPPIRVVPSADPPNCALVGGIGNRELKRL